MDTEKLLLYENQKANPTLVWILFLFLGWSYGLMNQMGLQIAYYLTFGGFGSLGAISAVHIEWCH